MQNPLRILVLLALLPLAGALHAQTMHIVCEGQSLQFTPESDYWGEPVWEYSVDENVWENLLMDKPNPYEIQPEKTGYYRLKLYDASCDSSFYSNVQFIDVRQWTKSLQLHSTHSGTEFNPGDSLYFWVDGENLPEGVEFYVNEKPAPSGRGTELLLPGMTETFTIYATAGHGENCLTTEKLIFEITSAGSKNLVPCEEPYPQVQNLSAQVSEALGGALLSWTAIQGSKGCAVRYKRVETSYWFSKTIIQNNLSSYLIPEEELYPDTDYLWSVHCGCSQNPLIVGPMSENGTFSTGGVGTFGTFPDNAVHCLPNGAATSVVEKVNPATGKMWMDRNLGASRVATAFDDAEAYGDLYQWGRFSDGHQCRDSEAYGSSSNSLATTPAPLAGNIWDGKFIAISVLPSDWLSPQNDSLWNINTGLNNPCPEGFRIPTKNELIAERNSWSSGNRLGAFYAPLTFPSTGARIEYNANIADGTVRVWSNTPEDGRSFILRADANNSNIPRQVRAQASAVRCISKKIPVIDCTGLNGGVLSLNDPINDLCLNTGSNTIQFHVTGNQGVGVFTLLSDAPAFSLVSYNGTGIFNLNDFEPGAYNVAYVSVNSLNDLIGVTRISQLPLCAEVSNMIAINTYRVDGGTLYALGDTVLNGGVLNFQAQGAMGPLKRFALLNAQGTQILATNTTGAFNFDNYPDGTYKVAHGAYGPGFDIANVDPANLEGCIDISNLVTVVNDSTITEPPPAEYPENSVFCASGPSEVVDILNPATGRTWMDRNLGASQVATVSGDGDAYGDLYQWGRFSDGHQCRNSPTVFSQSSSITPGHDQFYAGDKEYYDWLSTPSNNLWQVLNGLNNPCPDGYRVPTAAEWNDERTSWTGGNNGAGAFGSPLKLTKAGFRDPGNPWEITQGGNVGTYWSSTIQSGYVRYLTFTNTEALVEYNESRAFGYSVRCIKVLPADIGTLGCSDATTNVVLVQDVEAAGVSAVINYTGGNGGEYSSQTINSTGVNGLMATLETGVIASGSGTITFAITGTPVSAGTASFNLEFGGVMCTFEIEVFSCLQVENLNSTVAPGNGNVGLSWNPLGQTTTSCEIEIGVLGNPFTNFIHIPGNGLNSFTLPANELIQNNDYQWRVRCTCEFSQQEAEGPWSEWDNFTTGNMGIPEGNFPEGTIHCYPGTNVVQDVLNPTTGMTWMDRNLGASRAATAVDDEQAYGDLYQWGRFSDGHQCRNSPTTAVLSSTNQPGHGSFILAPGYPYDWRSPQNNNLWQGVNGINNPCPDNYRLPTEAELNNERTSWITNNANGAFGSALKLSAAGHRNTSSGVGIAGIGTEGRYWSSSFASPQARNLSVRLGSATINQQYRASGLSVRCIKDIVANIDILGCSDALINGAVVEGVATQGVSAVIPYQGGNGGVYPGQIVSSVGVGGLTATLEPGVVAFGNGTVTYTISGTAASAGIALFNVEIGGQPCILELNVYTCPQVENLNSVIASDSAEVNLTWNSLEQATTGCEIEYVIQGYPFSTINGIAGDDLNSYTLQLDGLFENTNYQWRVRCSCDFAPLEGVGPWSEWDYFTTGNIGIPVGIFPEGTVHCVPGIAEFFVDVLNPMTGKTWMDRNLGAARAANASNDAESYGDLYQWGRFSDGHQCRTSPTTSVISSSEYPDHGAFILSPANLVNPPFSDWLSPQSDNLWQGLNGINNPCPEGYRLPTESEWNQDRLQWSTNYVAGAFNSPLKLPAAGGRSRNTGAVYNVGAAGHYWSSTVIDKRAYNLDIYSTSNSQVQGRERAEGRSVRCIKDTITEAPASIQNLGCSDASTSEAIVEDMATDGMGVTVPYTGGNGGIYPSQSVNSSGVEGLTASLTNGQFSNGDGSVTYNLSGTPANSGIAFFELELGGQFCTLELEVASCGPVDNLQSFFSPDSTEIDLEWNALAQTTTQCQVEIRTQQSSNSTFIGLIGDNLNTATIQANELFQNTDYEWRVRCRCDYSNQLGLGPWSDWASFTNGNTGLLFASYREGTVHCIPGGAEVVEELNPATGEVWMDRNLGASNVATAYNDESAYGDLFQWGRFSDGHQCRNSATTTVVSSTDTPGHGLFILSPGLSAQYDWRTPQNNNLWQNVNGINNPCPYGFRIPTEAELNTENLSWNSDNRLGAFASPLKLTTGGYRGGRNNVFWYVGSSGHYWSSNLNGVNARNLFFNGNSAYMYYETRADGQSVRCIRE